MCLWLMLMGTGGVEKAMSIWCRAIEIGNWKMVGGCAIRTSTYRRICTHMEAEAFDIHLKCLVIIHVFENEMWKMVPLPLIVVTESVYVIYRLRGCSKQFICPFKFYIKPTTTVKEREKSARFI